MKARMIVLLFLLAVVGCEGPAVFTSPLSEPGQVPYDKRLIGTWYWWDPEEEMSALPMYFSIRPRDEHQLIGLSIVTDSSEKQLKSSVYALTLHPSTVSEDIYYNVSWSYRQTLSYQKDGILKLEQSKSLDMDQPDLPLVYLTAKIELVDENWAIVHFLGNKSPKNLMGWEALKRMTKMGEETVFDVSTGELRSFIGAAKPTQVFSSTGPFVYRRVAPLAVKKAQPAVKERLAEWKEIMRQWQGREASPLTRETRALW